MAGPYAPDTVTGATPAWYQAAACRGMDPEVWFPAHGNSNRHEPTVIEALRVCWTCPSRHDCLVAALREEGDGGEQYRHGIRGGLTSRERLRLRQEWLALTPGERRRQVRQARARRTGVAA